MHGVFKLMILLVKVIPETCNSAFFCNFNANTQASFVKPFFLN